MTQPPPSRWTAADIPSQRGLPRPVRSSAASRDRAVQHRLWTLSEQLTGVAAAVAGSE